MPCSAASSEGFFWRPWPCAQCHQGLTPIGYLFSRIETGTEVHGGVPEEITKRQVAQLIEWVEGCVHSSWENLSIPYLTQGSEHAVYLDAKRANVFKHTLPETFGEYYYLVDGLVHQEKCTPLEYLIRLHFWQKIFRLSPVALGITKSGQIVSRQEFISGSTPSQDETDEFLLASGLSAVKMSCWLWKRSYPEFEIWVGDARCDNFVKTESGIAPIDLRVWATSKESD